MYLQFYFLVLACLMHPQVCPTQIKHKEKKRERLILYMLAYLPSSFAMCCVFMAFSYALKPVSDVDHTRTYRVVFWIGLGALAGWPFAALIGLPFAIEEILVFGRDMMKKEDGTIVRSLATPQWRLRRFIRLLEASFFSGTGLVVSGIGKTKEEKKLMFSVVLTCSDGSNVLSSIYNCRLEYC